MRNLVGTLDAVTGAFGNLGTAIKNAADQLGRLLLRADGFAAMDKSGWGKGTRNFGASYKEQEAALFAAANQASASVKQLPSPSTTVPSFSPSLSGGGGSGAAPLTDDLERLNSDLEKIQQIIRAKGA